MDHGTIPAMTITILGLGPGDAGSLTRSAWEHIEAAQVLYLRTKIHPTVAALPPQLELRAFDTLYEQAQTFDAIYQQIAQELVARAQAGEHVLYAVPGHPLVAEATTRRVLALAREHSIPTTIIAGLSFVEPVCAALDIDPLEHGLQLLDALDLVVGEQPDDAERSPSWASLHGHSYPKPLLPFPLLTTRPVLICQLYNRTIASHVKLSLMERYPANHPITLVRAAGITGEERVWSLPLHELDHDHTLDHLTCAFVPALAALDNTRSPDGITYVVSRLFGPDGCPWDREQTHVSLRGDLLEETHEVLEALDAGNPDALVEELGDLLLQVMMHSEIARQAGDFDLNDVYAGITTKLIRRHPHVFGEVIVDGSGEVLRNWDAIKRAEYSARGQTPRAALDGIPASLPALAAAQALARKAAKAGFEWLDTDDAWAKLHEEIQEVIQVVEDQGLDKQERAERLEAEFGDLLLAAAVIARRLGVDAESALRSASTRFRARFAYVEQQAGAQSQTLSALSQEQKLALWNEAKATI